MRLALLTTIILSCTVLHTHAADSTSLFYRITNFPNKLFNRVNSKTKDLDKALDRQTEKYLNKLARQEKRLQKKLYETDSVKASALFAGNPEMQYAAFIRKIKSDSAGEIHSMGTEYLPYADSLQGSLSFLSKNPELLNSSKILPADIANSLNQVKQLQVKMQDADQVKLFIQQRKEQIRQYLAQYMHLPAGLTGIYSDYNKQLYYYSEQLRQYRQMLNDPDKMMIKALSLLNKLPAFANFMKSNSFLAGLFTVPADYGSAEGLQGLQTRDQVLAMIQNQVSSGGSNAAGAIQSSLQSASQDMDKLHDKLNALGGGSSDMDIPNFKPNRQKTKTFLQRLEYGTMMQTQHSSYFFPTTTDLGLSVAYRLNDKNSIGVGASYKIGWGKDISHISISSQGIGLRSFIDLQMKKSFYATGGFEYNYQQPFYSVRDINNLQHWQQSGLIGVSKIVSIQTKVFKKTKIQLLWDFMSYEQIPKAQPFKFRVGYNF